MEKVKPLAQWVWGHPFPLCHNIEVSIVKKCITLITMHAGFLNTNYHHLTSPPQVGLAAMVTSTLLGMVQTQPFLALLSSMVVSTVVHALRFVGTPLVTPSGALLVPLS